MHVYKASLLVQASRRFEIEQTRRSFHDDGSSQVQVLRTI